MAESAAPPDNKKITYRETFYSIIETLTSKFTGLSPIELLNTPTSVVLELWADTIINSKKNKRQTAEAADAPTTTAETVYSWNASWY